MANYFIRVELHDADEPFAYEELHKKWKPMDISGILNVLRILSLVGWD
ncbi:hypothetical protein HNE31_000449 [Salmonella enterica]|nr:hypothetical protein [Salmonella enterica]